MLAVTVVGDGTVSYTWECNPGEICYGEMAPEIDRSFFNSGETLELKAESGVEYRFDHWEGDVSGTSNPATVTMNGDVTLVCVFTTPVKWRFDNANSSPAIGSDGTIYVGSGSDLCAVNPDGSLVWTCNLGAGAGSPSVASDGTIYIGAGDYLCAVDPAGTSDWSVDLGGSVSATPAIAQDGTVIVGNSSRRSGYFYQMYGINPDGTGKWHYFVGSGYECIYSSAAIASDGTVYFGCMGLTNGTLFALNPNGTFKWSFVPHGVIETSSPAIDADGTVYVGTWDAVLQAVNPDGSEAWSLLPTGTNSSPAIAPDGTLYMGTALGLYAVNPDGSVKWHFACGNARSAPAIGADGSVYFDVYQGAGRGFHALNSDGTERWYMGLPGSLSGNPVIGSDGTIYFVANGKLYAIEADSAGPAASDWPMFHHDAQHTGRQPST